MIEDAVEMEDSAVAEPSVDDTGAGEEIEDSRVLEPSIESSVTAKAEKGKSPGSKSIASPTFVAMHSYRSSARNAASTSGDRAASVVLGVPETASAAPMSASGSFSGISDSWILMGKLYCLSASSYPVNRHPTFLHPTFVHAVIPLVGISLSRQPALL